MNADEALELARKAYPNDEDLRVAYMLGLGDGYELHEERMLKEAVEYEVWDFSSSLEACPHVNIPLDNKQYRSGDKVRVIIVKED